MAFFYFAITILYFILILSFLIGWIKIKTYQRGQFDPSGIYISLIIAAKNEKNNIPKLLNLLTKQTISESAFEIILVNDHSKDNTLQLANNLSLKIPHLKVLNLPDNKSGKKQAVKFGVKYSKGQLIVTTDADCLPNQFWLETLASFYLRFKPKLIIAPVLMQANNSFEKMQALDFFSLMASGAGASGIKQPIMCNGANLAFEKSAYNEFNDPHNHKFSSGDDVFLLLNMKKNYRKKILFIKSADAIVFTKAEKTLKHYVQQRIRWASKSSGYRDSAILTTSFLVLLINLSLLINLISCFFFPEFSYLFLVQLIAKSIIDFIFLFKTGNYFKKNKLLWYFIPTQLANIFLIPYFALAGIGKSVKWKE